MCALIINLVLMDYIRFKFNFKKKRKILLVRDVKDTQKTCSDVCVLCVFSVYVGSATVRGMTSVH